MQEILESLPAVIVSAVVSTIIGLILKTAIVKRLDLKAQQEAELDELREREKRDTRKKELEEILKLELVPVEKQLKEVSGELSKNTQGTVTLLREAMKDSRDKYLERGYISTSELANWHHLYNEYAELGGNHFKEYVEEWCSDVENLDRR